ncbi:MerR family transcriptional regulator [Fimbriiglobus ruber]|uniref:Transcriptional regulator, MerR family n=1 Tax=Fimbriiglobus ruber TaxID=1908690 RepID=A0A225DAW1_9BACT|nr:MerR family transcriptional regulator [Fimbriiglobus ruber]OWK35678.1 Transcriptional regulator, MerR family [Fimbriiglobus ruber]
MSEASDAELFKVGDVARRTGVTVRTLHHYDEIGLLVPTHRAAGGHRLYTAADLARLQQILSLRHLGFGLDEIRDCLTRPGFDALTVVRLHLARVRDQLRTQHQICSRLETLADALGRTVPVSAELFLQTIEATVMFEKYYTPEQLDELKARREQVGEDRMRQVGDEWKELMAAVRTEMDQGADPADPRVQALAKKWMALVHEFTGGNPGIAAAVRNMYESEPVVAGTDTGPLKEMRAYIERAMKTAT